MNLPQDFSYAAVSPCRRDGWLAVLAMVLGLTVWAAPAAYAQSSGPDSTGATVRVETNSTNAPPTAPPLTDKRFYEILLADIALQRQEPVLAARLFLTLAKDTQSPWFAQRATESALTARDQTLLKQALEIWQTLDPQSDQPKRIQAQIARALLNPMGQNASEAEIRVRLEALLKEAAATDNLGDAFLQLNQLFAKRQDKIAAFNTVRALASPYMRQPEAHYAVALAALLATTDKAPGDVLSKILEEGVQEIDLALAAAPAWEKALQLKAALLEKTAPEQLLPWLQSSVQKNPEQKALWPLLARVYAQKKRYSESREWFLKIWKDSEADSALMAAGALSMQMEDRAQAEVLLEEVEKTQGDDKANALRIMYARVSEDEKRPMEAIEWYRKVDGGDDWWGVQLQLSVLLAKNGKKDEALMLLKELPAITLEERIGVLQMQSRILRDAEDWGAVQVVLAKGVQDFPESTDLLLELALVEEKRGNLEAAEQHLRKALSIKPDEPYLLNALGYTLIDHHRNLEEGAMLIEKAHQAMPDDGAILDSMGWARYRQGKLEDAARYLQQAMEKHPDAEVAAHLGEVLWRMERRDEARQVWQQGLQQVPRDRMIRETMQRLDAGELPGASAP